MKIFILGVGLVFSASAMDIDARFSHFKEQVSGWDAQGNKGFFKILFYFLGVGSFEGDYREFKDLKKEGEELRRLGKELKDPACFHWDFICTFVPHGMDRK